MAEPQFYLQKTRAGWWVCYDSDLPECKPIGPYSSKTEAASVKAGLSRTHKLDPALFDNGRGRRNCNREHPYFGCECQMCAMARD